MPMAWPPGTGKRIPERTRRRILERDAGICCVCHQPGANQVDHVVPRSQGGTDDDTNLAAIHDRPCHLEKTQRESAAARHRHSSKRPMPKHPGLL